MITKQSPSLMFILIILLTNAASGWNLYKSNHPTRKTSELFERLSYHEIITFRHNQFHKIDGHDKPLYPMNGKLEFNAFGNHYSLLIRKNVELFSDKFKTELHRFNKSTQIVDKYIISTEIPQCYYTAEMESLDLWSKGGVFSACVGQGIRGWIHAYNETIIIRPAKHLMDITFKGKHKISDNHIIYKYNDLDRSDYPHNNNGHTCGHNHPNTPKLLKEEINKYKDKDPSKIEWIKHQEESINYINKKKENNNNINNNNNNNNNRNLLSNDKTTRYVELAIVNDPGMLLEYENNYAFLREKTISIVSTLQNYYLNTEWDSSTGNIQIVLSAIFYIESFDKLSSPALSCIPGGSISTPSLYKNKQPTTDYCEVSYSNYLSNFQSYRSSHLSEYDNAQLFSYYDFESSVIGYASLPGMCIGSSSGGIEQCTYDDEYNGNIVAHEMGHNFFMQHDGNGNTCDKSSYIMASVGSPFGARPDSFSSCSIDYNRQFFNSISYSKTLKCLDNKPTETSYAVCRNGFVESGESCDCGQSNCATSDPCCDGSTCALYASSECSNNDICCEDCKIKSFGTICRELDITNPCDIEQEVCNGKSSECPPDNKYIEGIKCDNDNNIGYCYNGQCKSIETQCEIYGSTIQSSLYTICNKIQSNYPIKWQVNDNKCNSNIYCLNTANNQCGTISQKPNDGIPCNQSDIIPKPSQCVNNICQYSIDIYTYKWTVNQWELCSIDCKNDAKEEPGTQIRQVSCTLQDGTIISDETKCDPLGNNLKPEIERKCNDFICNFCQIQPDGSTICGDHGTCESELKICDCDSGYAGERCDEPPGLNFTGIVSQVFKNVTNGYTIALRANPCYSNNINNSIFKVFDQATETLTVPINDISTLSTLYIGATVGIRWESAGDIQLLAVGMIRVNPETGDKLNENTWPFYVGPSLATDDNTCDNKNNSNYDGCFQKLECNDFTFTIPTNIEPGTYKVIIRFNNEFSIKSPIVNIICNENNCNSVGHGKCNIDETGCVCDNGWSGNSCSYSLCDNWSFAVCQKDNEGNCGSLGQTDFKPKCFNSTCNLNITDEINQCTCDEHFEGKYCEIPKDHCSFYITEDACNSIGGEKDVCKWNNNINKCLYNKCSQLLTQEECIGGINGTNETSTYFISSNKWSIFCEWNDEDEYCNRVTCGNNILPECANGAVRRPLFDKYSDEPISICYGWYCDCSTISNIQNSKWKISSASELLQLINTDYNFNINPLTSQYIIDENSLNSFTCSKCSLQCKNDAKIDNECTNCNDGCPIEIKPFRIGIQCDQVFWIGNFRLNVNWDVAFIEKWQEFENLIIQDLAYFLGTDINHISIWQLKPDTDGSIIYFRYLFDTNNDDDAQITGGDVMALAAKEISDPTSTATRGFIMQYTDSTIPYSFCVPTKEECDPSKQINILFIFYICAAASFGFVILFVIIYRIATRGKRQRAYEAKVREVRQAQLRLMEHHSKARRVGMRDVSKNRAHKIHKAQKKREKEQKKEIQTRAKEEKKLNKIKEEQQLGSHEHQDSQLELEQYRRYSKQQYASSASHGHESNKLNSGSGNGKPSYAASAHGYEAYKPPQIQNRPQQTQSVYSRSSRAHSNVSNDPTVNLPIGWKVYYNNDGVPYYFNSNTGETTWRHPGK